MEEKEIKLKKYTNKIYMNWIRYFCPCFFNNDNISEGTVHSEASTVEQFHYHDNPMLRSVLLEE